MDNQETSFLKNLVIAVMLYFSPIIGFLHTFETEGNLRRIVIFGWEYVHGYEDDQYFLYDLLRLFTVGFIYGIWYFTANKGIKFFLLFLFWLIISKLFIAITPVVIYDRFEILINCSIGFALILFYSLKEFKFLKKTLLNIKSFSKIKCTIKYRSLGLPILLFLMPFIHQIWILTPKDTTILDQYFFQIDHLGYGDFVSAMYNLIAKKLPI